MADFGLIEPQALRRLLERLYLKHRTKYPTVSHQETVAAVHQFLCGKLDQSKSDALQILREIKAGQR